MTVKTLPRATCQLHTAEEPTGLRLNATDEGFIHFYESAAEDTVAQLILDCRGDDGTLESRPVEFVATSDRKALASGQQASPMPVEPPSGTPRTPLSGDVMGYTQPELIAAGYLPRPDPVQAPSVYATWLRDASAPATRVSSRVVPGDAQGSPQISDNWSGYVALPDPGGIFMGQAMVAVLGDWVIPPVFPQCHVGNTGAIFCNNGNFYEYEWVGIDGAPGDTSNFLQDGTGGEVFCPGGYPACSSKIIAWEEYFPTQATAGQEFPNLVVNAGDEVVTAAWVGDQFGTPNLNGGFIYFYIHDLTTTNVSSASGPAVGQVPGYSAEWIMERPSLDGSTFTNMAGYGAPPSFTASMSSAEYYDNYNNWYQYSYPSGQGSTPVTYEMHDLDNGTHNLLSSVSPCSNGDSECMTFQWHNFN